MNDPYDDVQNEVQSSLQATLNLFASYNRIKSTAKDGSEELKLTLNELHSNVESLTADLEDLEESVKVVEETGPRLFGLEESEVMRRRKYVGQVRMEIENMKSQLSIEDGRGIHANGANPFSDPVQEDDQAEWSRQEQQMLVERQDHTLESIQGTLTNLAQQAGLMGQEIGEHNEMLDDLESGVDRADSKLNSSLKKLKKFIQDTEETKSGWCIGILIVILCVLLLMVVLI